MNIGVTGTQYPAADSMAAFKIAEDALRPYLQPENTLIHGACVGMDAIAAVAASYAHVSIYAVVPAFRYKTSDAAIHLSTTVEYMPEGTTYMQRNDRIIALSDILLAFPKTEIEELRSGTWATIRRARKKGIPVFIYPVGGS